MTQIMGFSGDVGITTAGGLQSSQGLAMPLPAGVPAGCAAVAELFD
jgi:hypothetical protein